MANKKPTISNNSHGLFENIDWRIKEFSNPNGVVRIGTSFSGIGAIEHAFAKLGIRHKIMFAGDIDTNCKKSYFANYEISEKQWHTDVHDFDAKPYNGKIDLFVGGAPCQAFSLRGKHGGFEDTRGTLFREFARIVMECNPKVFIFENVKGLLSHDKGRTWKVIKETFEKDCKYDVHFQILNGRDFGIPQSRERLFCVGFKKTTNFTFPTPIPLEKTVYDFLQESFDKKYLLKQKGVHFITRSINHQKSYTQINGDVLLCQKRNQQFNWHGDFIFHPLSKVEAQSGVMDENIFRISDCEENYYLKSHPEKYSITKIEDGHLSMQKKPLKSIDINYGRFRKLTPRECLRLMGFDDSFKIVVNDTETYRQAGNSIIVDVLIALLKELDITRYAE